MWQKVLLPKKLRNYSMPTPEHSATNPNEEPRPNGHAELIEVQEAFGFFETPELSALHSAIVQAAVAEQTYLRRVLTDAYQVEALHTIGGDPPLDIKHGYLIAQAVIKLEAGYDFACLDDLEDVYYSLIQLPDFIEETQKLDAIMRRIEQPNNTT